MVEFTGELACVSGRVKQTSGADNAGNGMSCAGKEVDGIALFDKCSEGPIFGSTASGWLCPQDKTACIKSEETSFIEETKIINTHAVGYTGYISGEDDGTKAYRTPLNPRRKITLSSDKKTINIITIRGDYQPCEAGMCEIEGIWLLSESYTVDYPVKSFKYVAEKVSDYYQYTGSCGGDAGPCPSYYDWSDGIILDRYDTVIADPQFSPPTVGNTAYYKTYLEITYDVPEQHIIYTCPFSGRPCIEDGGGYSCSPGDCAELGDSGNFAGNPDETPEGSNDADNNGPTDDDGNCLGKLVIFPGNDKRCRMVGLQSKGFQCCKIIDPKDADKSDVILFPSEWEFNVCNGSERSLAVQRAKDQCVSIGTYCAEKWKTGLCVQQKETFCCFDSDFSRAFNEAGMDMLNKSWGTPEAPNCGGFSPEELQELSAMNISDHPKMQAYAEKLGEEFSGKLMNEFEKTFKTPEFQEDIKNQIEGAGK